MDELTGIGVREDGVGPIRQRRDGIVCTSALIGVDWDWVGWDIGVGFGGGKR